MSQKHKRRNNKAIKRAKSGKSHQTVPRAQFEAEQARRIDLESKLADLAKQHFMSQRFLLGAVLAAGGRIDMDDLPPGQVMDVMAEARPGGVILTTVAKPKTETEAGAPARKENDATRN